MKLTQRLCAVFGTAFGIAAATAATTAATAVPCQAAGPCQECEGGSSGSYDGFGYEDGRPVGARQKWLFGKPWPPYPRPTGPQQSCAQRYHAAHYWPHPYVCQDRASVFEHTQAMVENGWVEQTTLLEYHFNDEEGVLTHAGEAHLRWILFMAPEMYRSVWVQAGHQPHVTDMRIQAVQLAAAEMLGSGHVPQISPRVCMPIGTPAQQIDGQYRSWIETLPEPRINYTPLATQQQ
jgi:hypothetical protein